MARHDGARRYGAFTKLFDYPYKFSKSTTDDGDDVFNLSLQSDPPFKNSDSDSGSLDENSSEISNDIVDIEIEHQAVGRKPMGDVRNIAGNRLSYRDYRNDKDQTAYDRMQELSGTIKLGPAQKTLRQNLRRLIESNAYQRLPPITDQNRHKDHPRSKAISKVINTYRAAARRQTHKEFKELRADLAKLLR